MDTMKARLLLWCLFLCQISLIFGNFDLISYKEMPPLYNFENYDACLNFDKTNEGTFCMVYSEITPNYTSALWQQIDTFSSDRQRHFRHDYLYFGVCLERCKQLLNTLTKPQIDQLYGGNIVNTELEDFYARVHKRNTDERERYDHLISSCLNHDFQPKYNLTLRTSIEYCEKNDVPLEHDSWDFAMYIIFGIIFALNVSSTLFDYFLKLKEPLPQQDNAYYKRALGTQVHSYLTAFSLCRNYYRITEAPRNKYAEELKFLNVFRAFGVFIVIAAHIVMISSILPIKNTEMVEQYYYRSETYIAQNGTVIVQTFFVMSGFLLCVNFSDKEPRERSKRHCVQLYVKNFLRRYFRLVPTMALVILVNATILTRLQDGPFWRHFTEGERVFCRELWWKNVFLINNFSLKESCSQHTWYLAAEMQLFELFLLFLILNSKYPQVKKYLYATLLILTFGVPAAITYFQKLNAVAHVYPETYRYIFFKDADTFYQTYLPFYTNLGAYFFGVWSGDIFLKWKTNGSAEKYRGVWRYELSWWIVLCGLSVLLLSGTLFMDENLKKPSIWLAIYAGLYRNLWSLFTCILLLGMCHKIGWIAYEFAVLSFFRPVAHLSYQAYLWHVIALRITGGYFRQPIHMNRLQIFSNIITTFVLTYFVAFLMAMCVEYPIGEIVRCLFKDRSSKKEIVAEKTKGAELYILQTEDPSKTPIK